MIIRWTIPTMCLRIWIPTAQVWREAIVKEFGMKERLLPYRVFRDGDDHYWVITVLQVVLPLMYNLLFTLFFGPLSYYVHVVGEECLVHILNLYCLATARRLSSHYTLLRRVITSCISEVSALRTSCQQPLQKVTRSYSLYVDNSKSWVSWIRCWQTWSTSRVTKRMKASLTSFCPFLKDKLNKAFSRVFF